MKINRMFLLACATAFIGGCASIDAPKAAKHTTYVQDALKKYVDKGELPGAISILYNNGAEDICCVGYSDMAAKRPISLDSHFMQCSQTKGFCGVTVAKLVEEGKVSLDDPISKYLPEYETRGYIITPRDAQGRMFAKPVTTPITLRMCLNHTAGFPFELPNYTAMGGWSRRMPLRSVAATAISQRLLFEPGTKSQYSNVGIDVAAAVVEVVTGMRWEDYLKKAVLDPLGMTETTFWPTDKQLENKIELYVFKKDSKPEWRKQMPAMQRPYGDDRVFPSAGAGLWTTARDQVKFYKMLMNLGMGENGVRILKEETVKNLLAVTSRDTKFGGYSLGLSAPVKDTENAWFGHGGAWGTNCSVNYHKKQLKLWVVQYNGLPRPWEADFEKAAKKFFNTAVGDSTSEYTGRMK